MRTFLRIMSLVPSFLIPLTSARAYDRFPELDAVNIPLLHLYNGSIILYGEYSSIRRLPPSVSPALAVKMDPSYNAAAIASAKENYEISKSDIKQVAIPKQVNKELLVALKYNPKDRLFMLFQKDINKLDSAEKEVAEAPIRAERVYSFSTIALQTETGNKSEFGYAWIGTSNPFKKNPVIKTLALTDQKPKNSSYVDLTKKLVVSSVKRLKEFADPKTTRNLKCEPLPPKSVSHGDVEFFAVFVNCTGVEDEPTFSELYIADGTFLKHLLDRSSLGMTEGYAENYEVKIFDILNDYSLLFEPPSNGDGSEVGCSATLLRDKKGIWKKAILPCQPTGC